MNEKIKIGLNGLGRIGRHIFKMCIDDPSIDTKIAVYHGAVRRSMTDIGYVVTGGDISLPQFDGYDIVMLGDIHKYQVLQEYKTEHRFVPESKLDTYKLDGWDITNE